MPEITVVTERRAFFTPRALAAYLALSERTVRAMLADGVIPSYRIEGSRRIDPVDVDAYLVGQRGHLKLIALDTRRCGVDPWARMATSGDLPGQLLRLRGVRLGKRERALLLAAPTPQEHREAYEAHRAEEMKDPIMRAFVEQRQSTMESVVTGMMPIVEGTRAAAVASHRAARRLDDLGLVTYGQQVYGERRVHIALTPLGAEVVRRYRQELERGQRIRWPKGDS